MTRAGLRVQRIVAAVLLALLALALAARCSGGSAPQGPVTRNANEALANRMAAARGWTGQQATCLDELWTEESGFSTAALNSSSGATGIPQLLPSAHAVPPDWSSAAVQIRWGLDYIKGTYGTPCAAWAHEKSTSPNWY
jgi:resuscitation-promoting factor RpfB